MKTGKKNILLAIGIISVIGVIFVNSHFKYSAFVEEFDYTKAQATGLPMLVEFGFQACPPCKMMIPVLKSLNKEHSAEFAIGYIDVFSDPAAKKKYSIEPTPTLIFFDKDGKELYRHRGFMPAETILAKWKALGVIESPSP